MNRILLGLSGQFAVMGTAILLNAPPGVGPLLGLAVYLLIVFGGRR